MNVGSYYVRDIRAVERTLRPSATNHFTNCTGKFLTVAGNCVKTRGEVENTMLEAKNTKKNLSPRPKPKTAFPRTEPLEAKDSNARGQGLKEQAQMFSKKKVFKEIFQAISKKKNGLQKIFFRRSPVKNVFQIFFSGGVQNFNNSKKVLSSSRGLGNFWGLEALRPRGRGQGLDLWGQGLQNVSSRTPRLVETIANCQQ